MGYGKVIVPLCRVGELADEPRQVLMLIIEAFCEKYGLYEKMGLPKEAVETAVVELVDTGL